ncbi:protein turtle homolog A isoform X3 [Coccinella septempunctata]|uniref:protein turtle homolog A isoform X3 n=1 Tax=Coccinella septempunctata TaxID=41139 RepID=UPI001D0866E7|nr:protein turtle homolog A isoform X3 [Coccinella septempunctata]
MYIEREPILYLLLFLISIECAEIKQYYVDRGKNLTLKCPYYYSDVMWVREGREDRHSTRSTALKNGSLFLERVDKDDSGIYSCSRENVVTDEKALLNVTVRTPPPALANVKVVPSTILAVIVWEVNGTGGYPIMNFTAQYRLADTDNKWIPIPPNHITPSSRQIDVYGLQPNTSYEFKVWATNQLGRGESTQIVSTTKGYYSEEAGADEFDTRAWAVAVGIVMGTLILLGLGTCFLLYQECRRPSVAEEQEIIELVPNIILNPGFDGNTNEPLQPDENSNSENPFRLNNNTVVQSRQA